MSENRLSASRWLTGTHRLVRIISLTGGALLTACSLLPSDGPGKREIGSESTQAMPPVFSLVDISDAALNADRTRPEPGFAAVFGNVDTPPVPTIQVGDGIVVDIWETSADPLFSSRSAGSAASLGARNSTLLEQTVGIDGRITVPYVGRVLVIGKSQAEVEQLLMQELKAKAARAEVVVHSRNVSRTVTVVGDVTSGARVPLSVQGDRLLDVLAAAGGIRAPTYETRIQLTRGGRSASLTMSRLLQDARQNIYLQPGDVLSATRRPQSFTAFGATGRNAQIEFGSERISLIEAMAKTGGLLDSRADPRGVYLLRLEPRSVAAAMGVMDIAPGTAEVRVVYRLDLMKAESYFLAQQFPMRDQDIVYVSSAPTNQLQKFLTLVGLISQPIIQGAVVNQAVK